MATVSLFMYFPLMPASDNKGLLIDEIPDHLESRNFVQCLLAPKQMGNNRVLIQNQTFGFFEHPYYTVVVLFEEGKSFWVGSIYHE